MSVIDKLLDAAAGAAADAERVVQATSEGKKALLHGVVALCLISGIAVEVGEQLTKLTKK